MLDGVVAFPHGEGCGQNVGPDLQQLQRTLTGVLSHPNIAGAIILGLGCEVNQIDHYLGKGAPLPAGLGWDDSAIERRNAALRSRSSPPRPSPE